MRWSINVVLIRISVIWICFHVYYKFVLHHLKLFILLAHLLIGLSGILVFLFLVFIYYRYYFSIRYTVKDFSHSVDYCFIWLFALLCRIFLTSCNLICQFLELFHELLEFCFKKSLPMSISWIRVFYSNSFRNYIKFLDSFWIYFWTGWKIGPYSHYYAYRLQFSQYQEAVLSTVCFYHVYKNKREKDA